MNIPVGKIIIGLLVVIAIVLGIGLYQAGQGTAPSPPTPSPTPTPTPTPEPTPPEEAEPPLPPAEAATEVPYVVTSTIQIPEGVTLTIEPGVTVTMLSEGDMFLLHGTVSALGTTNNKIVFDGGGNSDIFTTLGGAGSADLDYCIIRNGRGFWDRGGVLQFEAF